ncbi:putative kinetochore protein spc24 [Vermiconidia calcicola]|uniref:Kinetochore protein spc24 n=1 Tax=Vermiconidia calcicola TaxID=1690605 RepID=A0ACC3NFR1_9PEZI|nr:putative kinetochore protein spc24 [Vermiconidia calcicola]
MVLFDEDPTALLKETTNQFHIAPDRDSLSRISDSLGALSTARQSRLDQHHSILKSLSRRLNGLEEGRRWEEDRHDAGGHAERMLKMDTEKFRIAKGVSDVEIEGERLEGELAGLRTQLDALERQGVEGAWRRDSEGEDEVVLKLHIYRSLGISANQDPSTGEFNRAVVRKASTPEGSDSSGKGDVNIINVDGKLNRDFYRSLFWDAL